MNSKYAHYYFSTGVVFAMTVAYLISGNNTCLRYSISFFLVTLIYIIYDFLLSKKVNKLIKNQMFIYGLITFPCLYITNIYFTQ
jgi:hypothetical protein